MVVDEHPIAGSKGRHSPPDPGEAASRAGYSHFWYYTTSYNMKNLLVSMGGTTPDIGRNFAGLQNAVSFLIESRGVGIGRQACVGRNPEPQRSDSSGAGAAGSGAPAEQYPRAQRSHRFR